MLRDEFDRVSKRMEAIAPKLDQCRKKLYIASLLSIALKTTGTVPEKISALGIEIKQFQQEKLTLLLGLICLYFLVEFIALLARERFTIWEWRMLGITLSRFRRDHMIRTTTDEFGQQYPQLAGAVWRSLNPLLYFALPIMVGLYGVIVAVFWSSIPNWLKF